MSQTEQETALSFILSKLPAAISTFQYGIINCNYCSDHMFLIRVIKILLLLSIPFKHVYKSSFKTAIKATSHESKYRVAEEHFETFISNNAFSKYGRV